MPNQMLNPQEDKLSRNTLILFVLYFVKQIKSNLFKDKKQR